MYMVQYNNNNYNKQFCMYIIHNNIHYVHVQYMPTHTFSLLAGDQPVPSIEVSLKILEIK